MDIDFKKLAPWNWFKNEQQEQQTASSLPVRGEKRQEQEKKEGGFHRVERAYGSFQRALNLPDDANQDSIKASFKNGVLTVTIDKREVSSPKQGRSIPING